MTSLDSSRRAVEPTLSVTISAGTPRARAAHLVSLSGAVVAAALALLGVVGWLSGAPLLSSAGSGYIPIAPSTAISFGLLAAALLLRGRHRSPWIASAPALVVAVNALARVVGVPFDPDEMLIGQPDVFGEVLTARMSPLTAMCLLGIGAAAAAEPLTPSRLWRHVLSAITTAAAWMAFTVLLGYLQGTPLLYGTSTIPMALPTALGVLAASVGVMPAFLESWPLKPFFGGSVRARLLRALVPATVLAFLASGFMSAILGVWEVAPAIRSVLSMALAIAVVIAAVASVGEVLGSSLERAETALQQSNDELEQRVRERTAALTQANEALTEASREAEQANSAKNVFLSRMSHDLRTPLNAIIGFGELLEMGDLTSRQAHGVRQILNGGRHLLDLITEILDLTRIESGRLSLSPEPVRVAEIVAASIEFVRPLATKKAITIEVDIPPEQDGVLVRADRQRLNQILLNLLSNAIKYNRPHGLVMVSYEAIEGDAVRIQVRDTGAGIPESKMALLFRPFERLGAEQSDVEGTGLGLALVQGLTSVMGGSVGVESTVDAGSTFWVTLPAVRGAAEDESPVRKEADVHAGPAHAGLVLYIEDNPSNVELMQGVIERRPGLKLLHAPDGRMGIELARKYTPSVILLDLHLPEMSGEEVLRHLHEDVQCRNIPVVVVTADAMPSVARRVKASGATAFLTKPLHVREVLNLLDGLLSPS